MKTKILSKLLDIPTKTRDKAFQIKWLPKGRVGLTQEWF